MNSARREQRGLTLLEVLIGFVIVAGSIGAVYSLLTQAWQRSNAADRQTLALSIAKSQLAAASIDSLPASGRDGRYTWTLVRRDYDAGADGALRTMLRLSEVEVTVSWGDEGRESGEVRLATLVPAIE